MIGITVVKNYGDISAISRTATILSENSVTVISVFRLITGPKLENSSVTKFIEKTIMPIIAEWFMARTVRKTVVLTRIFRRISSPTCDSKRIVQLIMLIIRKAISAALTPSLTLNRNTKLHIAIDAASSASTLSMFRCIDPS